MARRQISDLAPTNAVISWGTFSGKPTSFDLNFKPIFEETTLSLPLWLEQSRQAQDEQFDASPLSEFEDLLFIGRIYVDVPPSLYLQENVEVKLAYTMEGAGALVFPARLVWSGAVAIETGLRIKQNLGEAISLIGKVRRRS